MTRLLFLPVAWATACQPASTEPTLDGGDGADGTAAVDGADGADGTGGTDGADGTDGAAPCTEFGALTPAAETVALEHWAGAAPPEARVDLTIDQPPCERFVAQGNPAWLLPTLDADAGGLTVTLDPSAGLTSGAHTGYVSLRDADDPTVLAELAVTVKAWLPPTDGGAPKVLVVGIDGLDGDELALLEVPHLARVARGGRSTLSAQTQLDAGTSSGPGWASILTGVDAEKHNIWSNGGYGARDTAWPSFAWRARQTLGLRTAASIQWSPIYEIAESDAWDATATGDMAEVAAQMAGLLRSGLYDVHFVHLDDVDGAGHSAGFSALSPTYEAAVRAADAHVGELLDAILDRPEIAAEDWLVVVTSDHGGAGTSHGCRTADCQTIPLYIAGASVPEGGLDAGASHLDVHPTVVDFLGLDPATMDLDGVTWLTHEEVCDDGLDDDGDGAIDCDDRDCAASEACWTCPSQDLGAAVGTDLWTGVADSGGFFEGSCGGAGWEATFGWTAPADAWYSMDTTGIYDDTVLTVVDGDCDGAELACNDDVAGVRSGLAVELAAGQAVVAVVDAASPGEVIDVTLSVYPFDGTCPHGDWGEVADTFTGTVPETDTAWIGGGCPPAVGGAQHTWTAPEAGTWTFSTAGSSFDTVLYITEGCDGADATLACNDDSGGLQSAATVTLAEGQEVVVTVGAFDARYGSGDYTLTVTR